MDTTNSIDDFDAFQTELDAWQLNFDVSTEVSVGFKSK